MTDVINKMIAVFLICVMLLLAPLSLMKQSDRVQNQISAVNAMEFFLDTVTDAHMIDAHAYDALTTKLEAAGITANVKVEIYEVVISQGDTYLWKTGIITDLNNYQPLVLGDIVSITVNEETSARAQNLWTKMFGSSTDRFNETLVKMVK